MSRWVLLAVLAGCATPVSSSGPTIVTSPLPPVTAPRFTNSATVSERAVPVAPRTTPAPPPSTVPPLPFTPPVSGDCDSFRSIFAHFGLPWDTFRPIMWRESRCTNAHNYNERTRDHSHGPLQINRWGTLAGEWDALGFDHDYMHTTVGAIHAAGNLYRTCGVHPWTDYKCGWPNGAPSRTVWP